MFPAPCEYIRATSAEEAIELLAKHEDAKLLAGGHSLIPMMKLRLAQPSHLIDIGRIDGLKGVSVDGGTLHIGALTTHAVVAASEDVLNHCPMLAEAASKIADPQVRNKGTVGGNIAHADPASDLPAVLVAAGATVHLLGPEGARSVAAGDFFVDLLVTAMAENEIVTAVTLPVVGSSTGSVYLKVEHPASGYAVCGAAATVTKNSDGVAGATLCFNGVAATPLSAQAVCDAVASGGGSDEEIHQAVDQHLTVVDPLGDLHASGEYRVVLARAYGKRALIAARDRAGS